LECSYLFCDGCKRRIIFGCPCKRGFSGLFVC
jgi:hypothetical protein